MAKKAKSPPLMNSLKEENTAITPRSSSSPQRETSLIDLPFNIVIDILTRLPLKSLLQFASVCKSWRTLFSTREIAAHFNQVSDKTYKLMRNADDWWNDSPIGRFKIPIELQSLEFMLLEPVNGILCIIGPVFSHVTYVYLWNPLTNEFKHLPRPMVQMGYVAVGFGFGFVPNNNDYKVVRVIQHERKCDLRVEIYSLNRNSWRRVRYPCSIIGNARSEFCSGDVTVDLENEVITEGEPKYIHLTNRKDDSRYVSRTNPEADSEFKFSEFILSRFLALNPFY